MQSIMVADSWAAFHKTKYTLALQSSSHTPRYLLKGIESYVHKKCHTNVYGSFLNNFPSLGPPSFPSVNMDEEPWYIQSMKQY
jgi:hypothetical protein